MEEEQKNRVYSSLSLLCFNLFLASLILVIASYFSVLTLDIIVNPDYIFIAGMFFGFLSLIFWENSRGKWNIKFKSDTRRRDNQEIKIEKNWFFKIVPYLFLFLLLVISLNQFFKWEFVTAQMMRITILAITFGALTFWRNRERVEKEIEDEKSDEESNEKKRCKEFDKKFKRLAWFNFNYDIASSFKGGNWLGGIFMILISPFVWFARLPYSFVKWMYKEGWGFSIPFMIVTIVFIGIKIAMPLIYNGSYIDEYNHILSGIELFKTGHFAEIISGQYYNRGAVISFLVGLFFKLFGQTLFVAKMVPAIISILNFFLLYFISKKIIKKRYILLLLIIYLIDYKVIFNDFYIRSYILYEFFVLSTIYLYLNLKLKEIKKAIIFLVIINIFNYLFFDAERIIILYLTIICFFYYIYYSNRTRKNFIFLSLVVIIPILSIKLVNYLSMFNYGVLTYSTSLDYKYLPYFFFSYTLLSIFFITQIFYLKRNNYKIQIISLSSISLFLIFFNLPKDFQLLRAIFCFLPLFYLSSIYSFSRLKLSRVFKFLFILILIFSFFISYPINFFKSPYMPAEVNYIDGQLYKDILNNCNNSLIITAGVPGIAIFNNITPDYFLNILAKNSLDTYKLTDGNRYIEVYSKIPILTDSEEFSRVLNSNKKVCFFGGELSGKNIGAEIFSNVQLNMKIFPKNYSSTRQTFFYIKS